MPVGYWPSAIATEPDGTIVVANLRGHGEGPRPLYFDIGDADIADSHARIDRDDRASVAERSLEGRLGRHDVRGHRRSRAGASSISCPHGANDFPVPKDNTSGRRRESITSSSIVRENKGYDGLFGDFPTGNGEPTYTFKTRRPA